MPQIELKKGSTLILHGPASAILVEGKASILGCPLSSRRKLVIKSWRSRPIHAEENSIIEYTYGGEGGMEVIDGDTIPREWKNFVEKIAEKKVCISVYGGIDSGKTGLATYILNSLVKKFKFAIYLDLDLGQSNICPPTTIGHVSLKFPIPDVSYLRMEAGEVVGYTSPAPVVQKHIDAAKALLNQLKAENSEASISADFDGWVLGEAAISHKRELLRILRPDYLASIGEVPAKLKEACEDLDITYEELPPPFNVRKREQAARKKLREISYNRFLRKASLRKLPITWINPRTLNGLEDGRKISAYIEKIVNGFLEKEDLILKSRGTEALEELSKKGAGLLSYVYDMSDKFAGIGLLMGFDVKKNYLKILTPYSGQIKKLIIGLVMLSTEGEELYADLTALAQAL